MNIQKGSQEIKEATEIIQAIIKAIKAFKIYPESSPLRSHFISNIMKKIHAFFEHHGDLSVKIRQREFLFDDHIIYRQEGREEDLPSRLHGDGIREIIFMDGLSEEEIKDFIEIISITHKGLNEYDDDMATLFWEKEFKNIRYIIVEDMGEDIAPVPATESTSGSGISNAHKIEVSKESSTSSSSASPLETEIEDIYGKPLSEIFVLTPEEIEKIQEEMDTEESRDLYLELIDILFHLLHMEEDIDEYREISGHIEKTIKFLLILGKYTKVVPVIHTLKRLEEDETLLPDQKDAIRNVINSLGEEKFLQQLISTLDTGITDSTEAFISFISLLNENAIPPLTEFAGTHEKMKVRRLLCDALSVLAKEKVHILAQKIEDENWYIVRNIVYILGKIRAPDTLKYIQKITTHPEPQVRKEIINVLAEINNEMARDLLTAYLKDPEPSIRIWALKKLLTVKSEEAGKVIWEIISSNDFQWKESYEKKAFFEALGRFNVSMALPYLREMLMKRARFFGKTKIAEYRMYALLALKHMSLPEAHEIIKEGAASNDRDIRNLCEDVLIEMERIRHAG